MTANRPLLPPDEGHTAPGAALDVACLCAAWCRTCDEYAGVFQQLQQAQPGHRYRWIDIEDEAELIGDVDVETFPTLLLAHQGQVLFAGPVLPRLGDAQRLLAVQASQLAEGARPPDLVAAGLPADQVAAFTVLAGRLGT
ncbi:MAG: thioredoxin [Rubrivivax sp.]|nr:MAG: thioredoxin [Rubrivivax sp.]